MKCIRCQQEKELSNSHVISKFIRMSLTGIIDEKNRKTFRFRFNGNSKIDQDLPKPKLMCGVCDNGYCSRIEDSAKRVLIPEGDLGIADTWTIRPLRTRTIDLGAAGSSVCVSEFHPKDAFEDRSINKFTVLTAWRALHSLEREGHPFARNFLQTDAGKELDTRTIAFLDSDFPGDDLLFENNARLHFLGPVGATQITGENDEMPFAWNFIECEKQSCVSVLMGYWTIIWPLRMLDDPDRDFRQLEKVTYLDWVSAVSEILQLGKAQSFRKASIAKRIAPYGIA